MSDLRWGTRWVGRASVLGWAYLLGLGACAGKVEDERVARSGDNLQSDTGSSEAALTSGANCERLLAHFQAELLEQVNERAEQARQGATYYGGNPLLAGGVDVAQSAPAPVASAPASGQALAGTAVGSGSFSDTTVQVPGVDEADFVKTDGDRIDLLHGPNLYVLGAASADATEILGTLPIEGEATELFVRNGKAVVFSRFYGPLPGTDQSNNPYYYYYYPTYTKLTVVDVSGAAPQVLRESYVEGSYVSSRRHDGAVRAIVQQQSRAQLDYPSVSYVDFLGHPYSQHEIDLQVDLWVSLATDTIADSVIEDYLPSELERVNGALTKQPLRCGDYWLPGAGLTQAGATSLVTLDLDEVDDPLRYTTVLGYADRVYANDAALLLTQTDYRYYTGEQTSLQTNIHRFDLDGLRTEYAASGSFTGYVQSQFSLDELDGVIRVSTTESNGGIAVPLPVDLGAGGGAAAPDVPAGPVSRILTLGTRGHRLVELGRTPDFGASEQIYAMGDDVRPLRSGEIFRVAGDTWTFWSPTEWKPTSRRRRVRLVRDSTLLFEVSRDEERVVLTVESERERIAMGQLSSYYLLLTLARMRQTSMQEPAPEESGWVHRDDLAHMLRCGEQQLNVWVHRIRSKFSMKGFLDYANVVERRDRTGQMRLGASRAIIRSA